MNAKPIPYQKRHRIFCVLILSVILFSHASPSVHAAPCGSDPVERMAFFGESTTAHLRVRGGIEPQQVWCNSSGTVKLDAALLARRVIEADGKLLTVFEAAAMTKPEILVLSFGLNGILGFDAKPEGYLLRYRELIETVKAASPQTRILVQSVYPVTANADAFSDWHFSQPPKEINAMIDRLNARLPLLCKDCGMAEFADTARALRDPDGALRVEYSTDGIHLTAAAYQQILSVLRLQITDKNQTEESL